MNTLNRRTGALLGLVVVLCVSAVVSLCLGPVSTTPHQVFEALTRGWSATTAPADALITSVRAPRILLCILVDGGLGVCGAAMQAVFRNPLAEPGITGVSAGAAVVAVWLITSGSVTASAWYLPFAAFLGALGATTVVQMIGHGARSTATVLLIGVAMNAFLGAITAALIANARNSEDSRSAMIWLNGDLAGRSMDDLAMVALPLFIGVLVVVVNARELDMLSLGTATAQSSGVDVRVVTQLILGGAALATAAGVAATGVISFVGLVVPHLVRLTIGSRHAVLLPACFLAGGVTLVLADTLARMILTPVVLQTGTITALLGAPFLVVLVLRPGRLT